MSAKRHNFVCTIFTLNSSLTADNKNIQTQVERHRYICSGQQPKL